MRSILLHIHDDTGMEARFQATLDLARRFDGHITCLQAVPYEFGIPGDYYLSAAMEMTAAFRESADRFQNELETRLAAEDVRWDWVRSQGDAINEIDHLAPLSEIVVLGPSNLTGEPAHPSKFVSEAVVTVRPPVLIVPAAGKGLSPDGPAIVAWNGSSECAHALQTALPILQQASEVHILSVRERKAREHARKLSTSDAAKFLARHDVEPLVNELPRGDETSIAATLIDAAQARKAVIIVMGAYGRSRFRERVLGGVTREMLSDPPIPLLLCH